MGAYEVEAEVEEKADKKAARLSDNNHVKASFQSLSDNNRIKASRITITSNSLFKVSLITFFSNS